MNDEYKFTMQYKKSEKGYIARIECSEHDYGIECKPIGTSAQMKQIMTERLDEMHKEDGLLAVGSVEKEKP